MCGSQTTWPVARARRGQREEDDLPANGFPGGCVLYFFNVVVILLLAKTSSLGARWANVCGNDATAENASEV